MLPAAGGRRIRGAADGGRWLPVHADLTELAVMWFGRALANLHKFWDLAGRADRYFRHHRPDAVVLIDYPGFNWWIAWRAKIHGIPVFYHTPPQIWAWATWRAKKMRRLTDHVLCSLPFEEAWFRQRGCNATFVGHPFFDEVRQHKLDEAFLEHHRRRSGPLVTILPGSRTQEVLHNLPWFLKAAARVRQAVPDARFAIAAFKPKHAEMAQAMTEGERSGHPRSGSAEGDPGPAIEIYSGRTPELMALATCRMACSGSVSMELLYHTKPTVIHYWIGRLAYAVQQRFRKVKYITLVNLLSTANSIRRNSSPTTRRKRGGEGPVPRVPHVRRQVGRRGRARDRVAAGPGGVGPSNRRPGAIEGPRGPRRGFGPSGGVYFARIAVG